MYRNSKNEKEQNVVVTPAPLLPEVCRPVDLVNTSKMERTRFKMYKDTIYRMAWTWIDRDMSTGEGAVHW